MSSVKMLTFVPSSVTTWPLTVTTPAWMRVSASRREQTPELAMNLLRRTVSWIGIGYGASVLSLPFTTGRRLIMRLMPSVDSRVKLGLRPGFLKPGFGRPWPPIGLRGPALRCSP